MSDEDLKIHIDSDWKEQAQAEKQRLVDQQKQAEESTPGGAAAAAAKGKLGEMPPASFETLMGTLISQALFAMGAIPDPATGQRIAQLDLARHSIDLLTVLEEKTKGNLSDEESTTLSGALYELRNRYVEISNSARTAQT